MQLLVSAHTCQLFLNTPHTWTKGRPHLSSVERLCLFPRSGSCLCPLYTFTHDSPHSSTTSSHRSSSNSVPSSVWPARSGPKVLSCGPASTVSYVNRVQPVPLSAPTARASPSHGDQSQTHSYPGEQYKGLGMPCATAVWKLASGTTHIRM